MTQAVRPALGFSLALTTAVLWGVLPIFLTLCLQAMDSATITTYRFATAGLVVALVLFRQRKLPAFFTFKPAVIALTLGATAMLVVNYVTNVMGLKYLSPASAQVLMQLAPFALMLGGVFFYKEHFTRIQMIGAVSLVVGLALFFNHRLPQIFASEKEDVFGIVLIVIAAFTWAAYALCQKVLLRSMNAMQLTLILYVAGAIMLLPMSELSHISDMNQLQLWALLFCCLNTLIAYGAFTEALRIWYASRVSAVLALAPLFTFLSMLVAERVMPETFTQPHLDAVAYAGASMVILGSVLAALGRDRLKKAG